MKDAEADQSGASGAEGDPHQPAGAAVRELAYGVAERVVVGALNDVQRDDDCREGRKTGQGGAGEEAGGERGRRHGNPPVSRDAFERRFGSLGKRRPLGGTWSRFSRWISSSG